MSGDVDGVNEGFPVVAAVIVVVVVVVVDTTGRPKTSSWTLGTAEVAALDRCGASDAERDSIHGVPSRSRMRDDERRRLDSDKVLMFDDTNFFLERLTARFVTCTTFSSVTTKT